LNLLPSIATIRLSEQAQLSAQNHKLTADRPDCCTIVPSKVGDRLEVRCQSTGQPHQFDIALRLTLQSSARLDPIQIAVEVDLEHRRRMIGWAPGRRWRRPGKTNCHQIQLVNKRFNDPNRVIFSYIIIERCRQ